MPRGVASPFAAPAQDTTRALLRCTECGHKRLGEKVARKYPMSRVSVVRWCPKCEQQTQHEPVAKPR